MGNKDGRSDREQDREHEQADLNAVHELLRNVGIIQKIWQKTDELSLNIDSSFTVFSALGIEELELKHCRIIHELLDPEGQHGMGSTFLDSFFRMVLGRDTDEHGFTRVYAEYGFRENGNSGRMDLYIETSTFHYPIEVKINASDQERQLSRYIRYVAEKSHGNFLIYYLTLDGRKPSAKSIADLDGEQMKKIRLLSFERHILPWLRDCEDKASKSLSTRNAIRHYITLIEKLTMKQKEEDLQGVLMNSVEEVIGLSGQYFSAARIIASHLDNVRRAKMKDVFRRIHEHMVASHIESQHRLELISGRSLDEAYALVDSLDFTGKVPDEYPALEFRIRQNGRISLHLVFEICWNAAEEDHFYYGVAAEPADDGGTGEGDGAGDGAGDSDGSREQVQRRDCARMFPSDTWKKLAGAVPEHSSWIWWKSLPSRKEEPDFLACDENYLKLHNPDDYERFMNAVFSEIDHNIESVIRSGVPHDLNGLCSWL